MPADANWSSALISAVIAVATGSLIAWFSKHFDARGQAEAKLVGIGPEIIKEQNERIKSLGEENLRIWDQLRLSGEREQACQRDLETVRRQLRESDYKVRTLEQRIVAIEYRDQNFQRKPSGDNDGFC